MKDPVSGQVTGVVEFVRDITERKLIEQALAEANNFRITLIEALPYPSMLIRRDRTIIFANRVAREVGAVVGGQCWRDFGHSDYISDEDKAYIDQHKEKPPYGIHCTFCLADDALNDSKTAVAPEIHAFGKIWEIYWVPVSEDVYLHYALDITERKQIQQKLEDYHHEMFRAEQLASLGTISATIAHELNQPLTAMQLLLQQSCRALGRKKPDISKIVENLNDCLGEVSRTVTTVDRFRKFAIKSSPFDVRKVDLAKTALAIVSVLKKTAKQAKLTMSLNIDKSPMFIRGNITEFEQIFFVVIQNAIQAADAKKARKLKISLSSASGQILLQFADTCGGVDPENEDKIFEPFFTTKPGEVGTGLGLCILERIVKRYDGSLRFENRPGYGITFYIILPVKS
jgi:signal transduction histidine kinase